MSSSKSSLIPKNFKFSWSAFSIYDTCPRDFKVKYLDKKWGPSNIFSLLGCALHNLIKIIYQKELFEDKKAFFLWEKILQEEYKLYWKRHQYQKITQEEVDKIKFYGFKLIKNFYNIADKKKLLRKSYFNEKSIEGNYRKHKFKAIIDCALEIDGKFGLIDWKTGEPKQEDIYQLVLYSAICQKRLKRKIDFIAPVYLKIQEIKFKKLDLNLRRKTGEKISKIYNAMINDQEFKPKKHKYCETCSTKFLGECPLFKNPIKKEEKNET